MSHAVKRLLGHGLAPAARLIDRLAPLKRLWAWSRLRQRVQALPESAVVLGLPEVHGNGQIHFGEDAYLYPDLYLESRNRAEIRVGNGVVISRGTHLVAHAGIEIGAGSMLGEYVSVRDANHRRRAGIPLREAGHLAAPICIGCEVWVGRGVIILPGVTVGDRAVIAANAVVNQDIPAGALAAGVPARVLRQESP